MLFLLLVTSSFASLIDVELTPSSSDAEDEGYVSDLEQDDEGKSLVPSVCNLGYIIMVFIGLGGILLYFKKE
jgi:hypothetical protein